MYNASIIVRLFCFMEHWENKSLDPITEFIEEVGWVTEEWKDCIFINERKEICDFTGLYKVSNFGRVKTLGNGNSNVSTKERIMSQSLMKRYGYGYLLINFSKNSIKYTLRVHILIAQAFIPNPKNKPQVNHKKGIKTDNRISQLEWATASENGLHAYKNGFSKPNKSRLGTTGKLSPRSKAINQFTLDRIFIKTHESMCEAQRETGIWQANISKVCSGIMKSSGGYIWEYK